LIKYKIALILGGLVKTSNFTMKFFLCIILVHFAISSAVSDRLYAPEHLWRKNIAEKSDPVDIADTHLGIPYRDDGALDDQGVFTTFDSTNRRFDTPGLNCSGLVVSVARYLYNKNWSLQDVSRDRQNNSGNGAPLGQDWDFGYDLILNLADGHNPRVIMPDGRPYDLKNADGVSLRGFDLDDTTSWNKVLSKMKPGKVYFGSISRPTNQKGYKLLHYHVVLMIPDNSGAVWLYHATRRSNAHKMNVKSAQGLNRFMSQFRGARGDEKQILIVEADLPDLSAPVQAVTDNAGKAFVQNQTQTASDAGVGTEPRNIASTQNLNLIAQNPSTETQPQDHAAQKPAASKGPDIEITHLAGKVFKSFPELMSHVPKFADDRKESIKFWFRNQGSAPKNLEIRLRGPQTDVNRNLAMPPGGVDLEVKFPGDFGSARRGSLLEGEYLIETKIDGADWTANLFEIAKPREAFPKILNVKIPSDVQSGKTFTVTIQAQNQGAESDYGGITISSPDPSGLRIASAKPGKVYAPGSTVLSVLSDKIKTKVPMAELWIELWAEKKGYEMQVQVTAGRPGTYPIYVRCALRGVNVKSSVILMDPPMSKTVDQQGFPVDVYMVNVR
jgi:hypothetical protein